MDSRALNRLRLIRALLAGGLLLGAGTLLLSGCTAPPAPSVRVQNQLVQSAKHGWQQQLVAGEFLDLMAFRPIQIQPVAQLTIYLEGDGLAWRTRTQVSANPTPINPIGLQLARQDPTSVYLARPCQYVSAAQWHNCNPGLWTYARFSSEVVQATSQAMDLLKAQFQAQTLVLVGYSGGAALACLVAARRDDVKKVITLAGNLDHGYWTSLHRLSPLRASLNPADLRPALQGIAQVHFVGAEDSNIPPALTRHFIEGFAPGADIQQVIVPGFTHECCWVEQWPRLLATIQHSP